MHSGSICHARCCDAGRTAARPKGRFSARGGHCQHRLCAAGARGQTDDFTTAAVHLADRQKGLAAIGKTEDDLRADFQTEAELRARSQILLLTVGRTEKLEVTEGEVDLALHRLSAQAGQDFAAVKEYYSRNNLLFALRDRLLADKAMDLIHQKATVTMVPPKKKDDEAKSETAE